jgi:DnaJ-class molecular chaperone
MDHYAILNLDPKSNLADIKRHLQFILTSRSFKKLALIYHPDKNKSPDAAQKFLQISDAYQFLIDPVKKRRYDATLANPSQARPRIFKTRKQPTQPPPTQPPGKPDPIPDSWYGKGGSTGLFGSKNPTFKAPEKPSSFAYKAPEQPNPFAFTEPFRFNAPERPQPANSTPGPSFFDTTPSKCKSIFS